VEPTASSLRSAPLCYLRENFRWLIQTRQVRAAIEETIAQGLPATYDQALFTQKWELVYQHVYDAYLGQGRSIYEHVA